MPRAARPSSSCFPEALESIRAAALAVVVVGRSPAEAAEQSIRVDLALLEGLLRSFLERVGRRDMAAATARILGLPAEFSAQVAVLREGAVADRYTDWLACAPWLERGAVALEEAACSLAGHHDKRSAGKFYTPPAVIEHIVDTTLKRAVRSTPLTELRVLEPSCGAGDFVVAVYDRLVADRIAAGEAPLEVRRAVLANSIYAVDSDPVAVVVTRIRLLGRLLDSLPEASAEFEFPHVLQENALWDGIDPPSFGVTLELALDDRACPASPHLEGGVGLLAAAGPFHAVVGNPPYGAELNASEKAWLRKRYLLAQGRMETAAIFLERAIEMVAPGGAVGLVMPHSLTRSGGYRAARRMLASRLCLDTLVDLGKSFPGIQLNTMVFTATARPMGSRVTLHEGHAGEIRPVSKVPRSFLWERETLSLHVDARDVPFWRRMEGENRALRTLVRNDRGFNLPLRKKRLVAPGAGKGRVPVVQGRDIAPYQPLDLSTLMTVDPRTPGVPAVLTESVLAVQNVSNVIEATLIPAGTLPLDTVNLLRPREDVDPLFLLAVLNSSIMGLYFRDLVINRATLTVHLDEPTLGGLPIVTPTRAQQRAIVKRVRELVGPGSEALSASGRQALVAALERDIDKLYQVPPDLVARHHGV